MSPTDWNNVALTRLTNVLGEGPGRRVMADGLHAIGLTTLATASDLHRFSLALAPMGGFAAAVGGLLGLHAVMHGDLQTGDTTSYG